uniref:WD_REPEATS_REGION domain-containing protein n=1 Tax=Thelazia callipaeda TaxID=103827 RepID=A0A0N5CK79_THECL
LIYSETVSSFCEFSSLIVCYRNCNFFWRLAFVASNSDVIVVDVETGRRKQLLAHCAKVVSLHFTFSNKLTTYTSDGIECVWCASTFLPLHSRKLNCVPFGVWNSNKATLVVTKNQDKKFIISKINESEETLQKQEILQTKPHDVVGFSEFAVTDDYFVCCEKLFVYLYVFGVNGVKRFKYTGKAEFMDFSLVRFTNIAACGNTVAAAISFGRVFIWNNVCRKGIGIFSHSVHWHKWAPYLALTKFNNLLSGGDEGVLAKFTLSDSKSIAKPQVLPRLQAPIRRLQLSADDSVVAVVLADNSVHFISNSALNVFSSMESILYSFKRSGFPLTDDPLYKNYVIHSARPGFIQWIDPHCMITVKTADISRENPVEGENIFSDTNGYTDVCEIAFSRKMVLSADCSIGFDIPNNRLQFWRRNRKLGSLALEYYESYCDDVIKFIRACLDYDMFITIDNKGVMVKWERVEGDERKWCKGDSIHWMDVPVLHVSKIRQSHFAAVHSITQDSNGVLVLWSAEQHEPFRSVHVHQGDGKIKSVEWGPSSNPNLLIVSSTNFIYAFNVSTLASVWIVCEPNLKLAISSQFIVAYHENVVSVIDTSSGTLLCQKKLNSPPISVISIEEDESFTIIAAYEKGYGVIAKSEIIQEAQKQLFSRDTVVKKTPFTDLVTIGCEGIKNNVRVETTPDVDIFSGPAYALAPMSYLAQKFIHSCFLPPERCDT